MTERKNRRRVIQGIVVGDKMQKTITVLVERVYRHPKYKKYVRRHDKYTAHDEANDANVGDRVELMGCRPLSKQKRWRLLRVVERATLPAEGVIT